MVSGGIPRGGSRFFLGEHGQAAGLLRPWAWPHCRAERDEVHGQAASRPVAKRGHEELEIILIVWVKDCSSFRSDLWFTWWCEVLVVCSCVIRCAVNG